MAQNEYFGALKQRHKRVRLLVKKLNTKRKKQAQKIDILCNDFIAAQRDFIKNLKKPNALMQLLLSFYARHHLFLLRYKARGRATLNYICSKANSQSLLKNSILRIVSALK